MEISQSASYPPMGIGASWPGVDVAETLFEELCEKSDIHIHNLKTIIAVNMIIIIAVNIIIIGVVSVSSLSLLSTSSLSFLSTSF